MGLVVVVGVVVVVVMAWPSDGASGSRRCSGCGCNGLAKRRGEWRILVCVDLKRKRNGGSQWVLKVILSCAKVSPLVGWFRSGRSLSRWLL